jgi:lysophospholipase
MVRVGDPLRAAWGDGEKPIAMTRHRQRLLTHDDARYDDEDWWRGARPELQMGGGSWGWVRAAMESTRQLFAPGAIEKVTVPTLVVATDADALVSPRATREVLARLPDGEALIFGKEARHEVLREVDSVRDQAMARIDRFLEARLGR